jgi:hypothetical protein
VFSITFLAMARSRPRRRKRVLHSGRLRTFFANITLKRFAKDKHSSLFGPFESYEKSFVNMGPFVARLDEHCKLSICNIGLEHNVSVLYKMVQYEIIMRLKFGYLKIIRFWAKKFRLRF